MTALLNLSLFKEDLTPGSTSVCPRVTSPSRIRVWLLMDFLMFDSACSYNLIRASIPSGVPVSGLTIACKLDAANSNCLLDKLDKLVTAPRTSMRITIDLFQGASAKVFLKRFCLEMFGPLLISSSVKFG